MVVEATWRRLKSGALGECVSGVQMSLSRKQRERIETDDSSHYVLTTISAVRQTATWNRALLLLQYQRSFEQSLVCLLLTDDKGVVRWAWKTVSARFRRAPRAPATCMCATDTC